jgi:hypothetical protein
MKAAKPKQLAFVLDDAPPKRFAKPAVTPPPPAEVNGHLKARSLSRRDDPESSHIAGEKMVSSGSTKSQSNLIENVLLVKDDRLTARTPGEIAKHLNDALKTTYFDSVKVLKRLNDLRKDRDEEDKPIAPRAVRFYLRRCSVNKDAEGNPSLAHVWVHATSCCAQGDHSAVRIPDSEWETVQCNQCFKGMGLRRIASHE